MSRILRAAAALGALAALSISVSAQTIGCEIGGAGGAFPSSGTGGGGTYPTTLPTYPTLYPLNVVSIPAGATVVTEVKFHLLAHTWINDCHFTLTDPAGVVYNVLHRPPGSCDFTGADYNIVPPCTGGTPWATSCTTVVAPGTYDQYFGTWASGTLGILNTPLDSIPAATGTWTLTAYDWVAADVGSLGSWDLCFGTPLAPAAPSAAPALTTPAAGGSVFGPTVNLVFGTVGCATSYEVDVDGTIYPSAGTTFAFGSSTPGSHTWTARGINGTGAGPWAASRVYNDLGPAPTPCSGSQLTTFYIGTNGGAVGGQIFFDINVTKPGGINVSQIDTNTTLAVGTAFGMSVYMKSGTYVGFENNSGAFTLMASGAAIAAGTDQHSLVDFTDFYLAPGTYGVALIMSGAAHRYTNGTGANQTHTNADITLTAGKALNTPWTGTPFSPRVWNGTLRYDCVPPGPVSYCTAGTTTNGCTATITGTANPSVSMANACQLNVANVEGQKSGLIFYGLGSNSTLWCAGGSSLLCVKAPTQRTPTQNSNGTAGLCDGSLTLDWNAFQTANPAALGNPWAAGTHVYAQCWFRDPPACKTTNLSDGLDMTYNP